MTNARRVHLLLRGTVESLGAFILHPYVERDQPSVGKDGMRECCLHENAPDAPSLETRMNVEAPELGIDPRPRDGGCGAELHVSNETSRQLSNENDVLFHDSDEGMRGELSVDVRAEVFAGERVTERMRVSLHGERRYEVSIAQLGRPAHRLQALIGSPVAEQPNCFHLARRAGATPAPHRC